MIFWLKISWFGEVSWYDWDPEKDELSPELGELNLSKTRLEKAKLDLEPVSSVVDEVVHGSFKRQGVG